MPYQILRDINIFQSSVWQTNAVVITNEAANIIIDPCYFPVEIQIIADFVNRRKSFNKLIIFTHSDFDHVIGYQYFKGAKLLAQEEMKFCDASLQLAQLKEIDQTYYIKRRFPFVYPELDITFETTQHIHLKDDELILFHAPGHTADSCIIISKEKRIMFAGDYLSDLEFPFVYFNIQAYQRSLELARKLVADYEIEYIVPGHGEVAAGQTEILTRIENDKAYLSEMVEKAEDLFIQGLQEHEIMEVLKGLKYRDEPITGSMLRMHSENIKMVLKELKSF